MGLRWRMGGRAAACVTWRWAAWMDLEAHAAMQRWEQACGPCSCTVSARSHMADAMRHASHGPCVRMSAMHCCFIWLMGRQLCACVDNRGHAALPAQSCCQTCRQCAGPLEAQPTFDLAALLATLAARLHAPAMQRTDAVCAAPCKPFVDAMQLLDEARSDPSAVSFAVRPVEVVMARSHSRDATSFSSLDGQAAPVAVGHHCRSSFRSAGKPRHVADSSAYASRVRDKRNRQGADGINLGLPAARASLLHAAQSPTRRAPSANLDKMLPRPAFGSSPNLQVSDTVQWSLPHAYACACAARG